MEETERQLALARLDQLTLLALGKVAHVEDKIAVITIEAEALAIDVTDFANATNATQKSE